MNPLVLKIGIPLVIIGALAFMRWTNKKSMGEPFFPTSDSSSDSKKGGGGGGIKTPDMNSPNDVIDNGTYEDGSYNYADSPVDDSSPTDPLATDPNIGALNLGSGGGGGTAGHGGLSASTGGVAAVPPALQPVILQNANNYTGGYQPYSPTPQTVPVANQFGGQGGGGVYAI